MAAPALPAVIPSKPWATRPGRKYRLVDARLIDPKDGNIYEHVTIDLRDGVVERMTKLSASLSPSDESLAVTHRDATVVNLDGRFVLPGLIDCHVHLAAPPGEEGLKVRHARVQTLDMDGRPFLTALF